MRWFVCSFCVYCTCMYCYVKLSADLSSRGCWSGSAVHTSSCCLCTNGPELRMGFHLSASWTESRQKHGERDMSGTNNACWYYSSQMIITKYVKMNLVQLSSLPCVQLVATYLYIWGHARMILTSCLYMGDSGYWFKWSQPIFMCMPFYPSPNYTKEPGPKFLALKQNAWRSDLLSRSGMGSIG